MIKPRLNIVPKFNNKLNGIKFMAKFWLNLMVKFSG
jgi:hypothetical protein